MTIETLEIIIRHLKGLVAVLEKEVTKKKKK
jgi:hypothetical protein